MAAARVARNRTGRSRDLVRPVPSTRRRRQRAGLPRSPKPGLDHWLHRTRRQRIALGMRDHPPGTVRLLLGIGFYPSGACLQADPRPIAATLPRLNACSPPPSPAPESPPTSPASSAAHPSSAPPSATSSRWACARATPTRVECQICESCRGQTTPQTRRKHVHQHPLPARHRHRLTRSGWPGEVGVAWVRSAWPWWRPKPDTSRPGFQEGDINGDVQAPLSGSA